MSNVVRVGFLAVLVATSLASPPIAESKLAANKLAANKLAANKLAANKLAANKLSANGFEGNPAGLADLRPRRRAARCSASSSRARFPRASRSRP